MPSSYTGAVPGQLHATIPSPHNTHACLTLYDVCPHTSRSSTSSVRCQTPYLHHDLPHLPPAAAPRTIEYIDDSGRNITEMTQPTLLPLLEPRHPRATGHKHDKSSRVTETTHSALLPLKHPKETAMTASLARLVLSKHSPVMHHVRQPTAAPPLLRQHPSVPTMYLISFSTDRTRTTRAFATLLNRHLPLQIPLRYTIDARSFLVPSRYICENYSGVTDFVQKEVLKDSRAQREIDCAINDLARFSRQGGHETGVAVCCTAGTHRSVAIAELIALGVRDEIRRSGSAEGVKVVVRHVHRIKGPKDPY